MGNSPNFSTALDLKGRAVPVIGDLIKPRLGIEPAKVRVVSPFIGGGFGGKGSVLADAVLAAVAARAVGRPVKVALQRPLMVNNTTHRPATIQRIRLGSSRDGRLTAIAHESWSGNLEGGATEPREERAHSRAVYTWSKGRLALHALGWRLLRLPVPGGGPGRGIVAPAD